MAKNERVEFEWLKLEKGGVDTKRRSGMITRHRLLYEKRLPQGTVLSR